MVQSAPDPGKTTMRLAREWGALHNAEIKKRMHLAHLDVTLAGHFLEIDNELKTLSVRIKTDPVASKIAALIDTDTDLSRKKDCRRVLRMFYFVDAYAPTFRTILATAPPAARRMFCDRIDARLVACLHADEIIEAEWKQQVVDMPDYVVALLQQAMMLVRDRWTSDLQNESAAVQTKFVRDIFNSSKGYSKTARGISEWTLPADFNFGSFMTEWLNGSSNVSPYDTSKTDVTRTRKAWMLASHRNAPYQQRKDLWIGFAARLGEKLGDYDIDTLRDELNRNRILFKQRFEGLVDGVEIDALIDNNLSLWWDF
jgi:hypothetical protein